MLFHWPKAGQVGPVRRWRSSAFHVSTNALLRAEVQWNVVLSGLCRQRSRMSEMRPEWTFKAAATLPTSRHLIGAILSVLQRRG